MTPVDIAADVVAGCLVVTQFVTSLKPLWAKLPTWLSVLCPVAVVCLPQVADAAGLVATEQGLVQLVVTAGVLLVPAVVAAETGKPPAAPPAA